jgi:transposase
LNCTPIVRQCDKLYNDWGVCMSKGEVRKTYSGEFKQIVIETMRTDHLSHRETARRFELKGKVMIANWERIYLEEGPEGLYRERRGRASAAGGMQRGRKPNLDKKVEEDLIAENQRLRAENDYLKKLNALVLEEERLNRRRK